ncbi:LOW QUALITY PROTEIN: glycerol-3-phosphate acyltransferase 2, mitochondrial [Amazona ochrocephala]
MRTWLCVAGQRVELVLPFLGQCRRDSGRCCQTCTPMSWDGFYSKHLPSLGLRDISRGIPDPHGNPSSGMPPPQPGSIGTPRRSCLEAGSALAQGHAHACSQGAASSHAPSSPRSGAGLLASQTLSFVSVPRFRGWLVRRACALLALCSWRIPNDTPGDLPARICRSRRWERAEGLWGHIPPPRSTPRPVASHLVAGARDPGIAPVGRDARGDPRCASTSSIPPQGAGCCSGPWGRGWEQRWKEKVLELLGDIQAPLSLLMLRICHWALLKLLSRLFLSVQLHRGQLEMVLRAASTVRSRCGAAAPAAGSPGAQHPSPLQPRVPLVFLCPHKSQLDGPLLSFVLFSQGLGVPRVTVRAQGCSPRLRSLLRRLGGIFLPAGMEQTRGDPEDALPGAVLAAYTEEVLRSRQPLLIFLEEPPVPLHLSASARRWLTLVQGAVRAGAVPDVLLVPVGIGYDVVPGGSRPEAARGAQPLGIGACLWAALRALRRNLGCVRVDFAQPFSLQVRQWGCSLGMGLGWWDLLSPSLWEAPVDPSARWCSSAHCSSFIPIPRSSWPKAAAGTRGSRSCCCCPASSARGEQDPAPVARSLQGSQPRFLTPLTPFSTAPQLDAGNGEGWAPGSTQATSLETPEEMLVTTLGLHSLSDSMSCSAIMAVGITSALLLHKYREGVFLSRLMQDFAWLLEEILLRQRDVGFSGQLRALVQHSLILLRARLSLYRLSPLGDILVIPKASAETWMELGRHSAAILPIFAGEAVGACAIRALLAEMLPFLEPTPPASSIIFSQDELHRKTLELLRLLPPTVLGLRPCQPLDCWSEDVVDKLVLCGLLEPEEPESGHWVCDTAPWASGRRQAWARMDFSDSEDEAPRCRCFKVRGGGRSPRHPRRVRVLTLSSASPPIQLGEPQGSPHLLLFLCRLLSPVLGTYAGAVAFLERTHWPQPEAAYVEELLQFLAKEGSELPNRSLALSSLQTFKEMGVLEEVGGPPGPLLRLAQPFRSSANRERLEAFIRQFIQA